MLAVFTFSDLSSFASGAGVSNVWEVLRREFKLNHEVARPEVQEQIRWLVAHPSFLQKVTRQSEPYIYHIIAKIKKRKLPGELALLPMLESAYDPFAYSGVGAAGLWQLMPRTGTDLGLKQDWWYDARRSIGPSTDAALNYLLRLSKFFEGSWILAIAAYDSGEGTIAKAIKQTTAPGQAVQFWNLPIPRETRIYVPRLLALAEIIYNAEGYKISLPNILYLPYFEEVNIGSQIDLNHAAKLAGISYKELIKLNPGFNRWTTAPYKPFRLLIPTEKVELFNLNLANVPQDKRVSWTKHQVKLGDNLNTIATRYHTTVNLIKELNQLTSNTVKPNQSILIPSTKNTPVLAMVSPSLQSPSSLKALPLQNRRIIHIVQNKETIASIQNLYGVSYKDIRNWNKISQESALTKGQQLVIWKKVRQPTQYEVRPGDSLSLIAKLHHTQVYKIIELNPAVRHRALQPGQRILIG